MIQFVEQQGRFRSTIERFGHRRVRRPMLWLSASVIAMLTPICATDIGPVASPPAVAQSPRSFRPAELSAGTARFSPQDLSPDFFAESVATFNNPHTNADCIGPENPNYCCTGVGRGRCDEPVESFVTVDCTTRNIDCTGRGTPNACCTGFQRGECCYEQPDRARRFRGNSYCPVSVCPDGCVNQWVEQSGYKSRVGSHPITGRTLEQDDLEKPCFKSNCINGHPCIVGHPAWTEPDYPADMQPKQDATLEIEPADRKGRFAPDRFQCPGTFYYAQLVRIVPQTDNHRLLWGFMRYLVRKKRLQFAPFSGASNVSVDNVFPELGAWYFIELQRNSDDTLTLWVNEEDKTRSPAPRNTGRPWSTQSLCNKKTCDEPGNQEFRGEGALLFYKCGQLLSAGEQAALRDYVRSTFNYLSPKSTTPTQKIPRPRRLTAVAISKRKVHLRWEDRSSSETQFEVQARVMGEAFQRAATVARNIERVVIAGLEPSTSYAFRVRARSGRAKSKWSNRARITMPP